MRAAGFPYFVFTLLLCACAFAPLASAHEVYVLSPEQVAYEQSYPSPNPFNAFTHNKALFFFSVFIGLVVVSSVFFMSITRRFEVFFAPWFARMRPHAATVARITLGICLLESAYNGALFGPELPFSDWGPYAPWVQGALYLSGILVVLGLYAKLAAALALVVFAGSLAVYGSYMVSYTNYLGEIAVVLMLGGGALALGNIGRKCKRDPLREAYAFLVLRIAFGISVIYAAVYGKFLYSNLALATIEQYKLTAFFPFDPLFTVLGACIIEVIMGIFFIVGFEVRHTALFFLFWIFLSLIYFGETVWPHLVLVGVNIALIMYGYDKLTVQGRFFNKGKLQPFL